MMKKMVKNMMRNLKMAADEITATKHMGIKSAKILFGNTRYNIGLVSRFYDCTVIIPLPWNSVSCMDRYMSNVWSNAWDNNNRYRLEKDDYIKVIETDTTDKMTDWEAATGILDVRCNFYGMFITIDLKECVDNHNHRFSTSFGTKTMFVPRNEIRRNGRKIFHYVEEHKREEEKKNTEKVANIRNA